MRRRAMVVDRQFCSDSFLMYRYIYDNAYAFSEDLRPYFFRKPRRGPVATVDDVERSIRRYVEGIVAAGGRLGLCLSGGIDSAILARCVPVGTPAYTFRCVADGPVADETAAARAYAEKCGLAHRVVEVSWGDYLAALPPLMRHKGAPVHSIEPQIFKAAAVARAEGVTHLLFGENADIVFGGMDGLLACDWQFDDFVRRYAYLDPERILKEGRRRVQPFERYRRGGSIDFLGFIDDYFYTEANNSYDNACATAGVAYCSPFNRMRLAVPLDLGRIRRGESKYLLRELFARLWPGMGQPAKLPMPRAVDLWLADWGGPVRGEFVEGCADGLSPDRRWMVFVLERFLNMIDLLP